MASRRESAWAACERARASLIAVVAVGVPFALSALPKGRPARGLLGAVAGLGIGATWTVFVLAIHVAFSICLPIAIVGAVLMGLSQSIGWSASNTFISALVRGPLRQRYFGVNFALLNLGIGVGGLMAGAFVDVARPVTFEAIFLLDAVLVLIPGVWLLGPLRHVHARAEHLRGFRERVQRSGAEAALLSTCNRTELYAAADEGADAALAVEENLADGMSVFAVLAVLGFGAAYVGPLTATGTDAHAAELDPVSLYASTIADAQAYLAASEAGAGQKQADSGSNRSQRPRDRRRGKRSVMEAPTGTESSVA